MKLETEYECIIARIALALLKAKLIALIKGERFDEIAFIFGEQKTSRAMILALFDQAEQLARTEMGLPRVDNGGPGLQ